MNNETAETKRPGEESTIYDEIFGQVISELVQADQKKEVKTEQVKQLATEKEIDKVMEHLTIF